jgi:hypothetical protein
MEGGLGAGACVGVLVFFWGLCICLILWCVMCGVWCVLCTVEGDDRFQGLSPAALDGT